jgi:hypothetical protein
MAHKTAPSLLIAALFAAITLVTPAGHAQAQPGNTSGTAVIVVPMARQPDAPLHITAITENEDMLAAVTVKNRSAKNIASYQLGWSIIVPPGCSATHYEPAVTLGPLDQVQIAPGATATARNYRLWASELENLPAAHNSTELHIQVGIIAVTFADGSHWNFDLASNKVFEPDPFSSPDRQCITPSTH